MSITGKWDTVPLGKVCRVIPGYAFKSKDWCDEGIPVIKIKNVQSDRSVNTENADCVPESIYSDRLKKFLLEDGDILLAMTGATAGKVGKLRTKRPMLLNQRVAKIKPVEADADFIWSLVSSDEYQSKFFNLADGAAQPNMSGGQIEGLELRLPDLPTQRKIAGILSAYDDLIENNLRRIKILEQMAQSLYREWFVHFRFPGHESATFKDSELGRIPKGWEMKKVGDAFEIMGGGTPSKAKDEYWEHGTIQWYSPRDLTADKTMFIETSAVQTNELGLKKSAARMFPAFSVMLTSRATIGAMS